MPRSQTRSIKFEVRLTPAELAVLKSAAGLAPVSAYVRCAALGAALVDVGELTAAEVAKASPAVLRARCANRETTT